MEEKGQSWGGEGRGERRRERKLGWALHCAFLLLSKEDNVRVGPRVGKLTSLQF